MYYNPEKSPNNMTYSIDMIRLKTYITYDCFSNLEFYLKSYHGNKIDQFWISDRIMQFKYNYKIQIEEGKSFYLGFHHNNENPDDHDGLHNLTIEFNPNKLKDNNIILYILNLSNEYYIKSYDLAIDLPINILDLIIDKGLKRKMKTFCYGFDDITYEVGKGDMRLKIYNKKKESNLDIAGELTRVEISRVLDDYPISKIKMYKYTQEGFPQIYTNTYICSLSDFQDKTLYAIVYAVQSGYPINQLSRSYKEKIKKLFEGGDKIRFTALYATQALHKTIFSYFIKNSKIRWY